MKKVLILGLGRATKNVVKFILEKEKGVELYAYEEKADADIDQEIRSLMQRNLIRKVTNMDRFDKVITSPGISEETAIVKDIRRMGLSIIDELEFTYQYIREDIIGVTGTNGKSTTTALIGHILKTAGKSCFIGGNLAPGQPFSTALSQPRFEYYCLEVSTFQLERIEEFLPMIGVLLNISADHLDRHRTIDEYARLKFKLFMNQGQDQFAVLNHDDERIRQGAAELRSQAIFFSSQKTIDGICYRGGVIYAFGEPVISDQEIRLPGLHNIENIMAATAVAKILKFSNEVIRKAVTSFNGLPHRLEFVRKVRGVSFVNNSMCTNPAAAIASLRAVSGEIIVILGGKEKGLNSTEYLDLVIKKARGSVLIGENKGHIADYFESKGYKAYAVASDMDEAVKDALQLARPGDTVILNPGFASFGDFKDFEERGEVYKDAVRKAR